MQAQNLAQSGSVSIDQLIERWEKHGWSCCSTHYLMCDLLSTVWYLHLFDSVQNRFSLHNEVQCHYLEKCFVYSKSLNNYNNINYNLKIFLKHRFWFCFGWFCFCSFLFFLHCLIESEKPNKINAPSFFATYSNYMIGYLGFLPYLCAVSFCGRGKPNNEMGHFLMPIVISSYTNILYSKEKVNLFLFKNDYLFIYS